MSFSKFGYSALQIGDKKPAPTAEINRTGGCYSPLWQFTAVGFGN